MIPIGVAPRKDDQTLTLVAKEEHWNQVFELLRADYTTHKALATKLKQQLQKGEGRRATLSVGEAKTILRLCGLSY